MATGARSSVVGVGTLLFGLLSLALSTQTRAASGSVTYSYDDMGRLRTATSSCGASTGYTLDAAGNRVTVQTVAASAAGTLQFGAATYSVSETNASVTIQVTRGCASSGAVSVSYTLSGTATQTTDYSVSGTLSWAAGDSSVKTLTLATVDNSVYTGNKSAILTLNAPTGGATIGQQSSTTVTITEDELPPVAGTVQFTASTFTVGEGAGSAALTISRPSASGAVPAASVTCTPTSGTATSGTDFTATPQTINWAANDVSNKTCSIAITNDTAYEGNETFTATLSNPTGGMSLGATTSTTVTITDNDAVSFSIANASVNEGAGTVTLTVTKTGTTALSNAVNYATANATATAGSDYTATSGTLTFAAADTTKTFTVPIADDSTFEGSETFAVNLSSPTNGATLGTASATVTITENDAVSFSIANASVNEGAGTVTLTVTKTGTTALAHNVNYATADSTAIAGSDYTATSGTLTFAAADTTKTFTVPITNDSTFESSETFAVILSSPTNGATLGTASATVTITDNDAVSFSIANASVNEGAGTVTLTVTKTGATVFAHNVSYATADGTAMAGSDYTATSGTLSFAVGDTSKTITVPITDDSVYEANETFTANLSSPTNGATLGTASATVTITENDVVSFAIANASVNEGAGTVTLTVTKTGATVLAHNVSYATADGTAAAGSDYTASSGTLAFAVADTSKTFTVPITDDSTYEGNETFAVNLSSPTNGATLGTASATVTITENDSPPSFAVNDVSVNETTATATFTVTKTGSTALTHAVSYATANGTATAGSDYTATSGTLTFAPADTSKTISVTILDDSTFEASETYTVGLSSPTNGATISRATGTGTILDNEPVPPPSGLTANAVSATEVDLSWTAAATGPAAAGLSYSIYKNGGFVIGTTQTTYVDTVVQPGTTYSYVVYTVGPGGNISATSAGPASVTTPSTAPSTAPTWTTGYATCTTIDACYYNANFTLTWNAPVSGTVTRYELEQTDPFGGVTVINVPSGTSYLVNFSTLPTSWLGPEMALGYRVRACNGTACGPYTGGILMTYLFFVDPGGGF